MFVLIFAIPFVFRVVAVPVIGIIIVGVLVAVVQLVVINIIITIVISVVIIIMVYIIIGIMSTHATIDYLVPPTTGAVTRIHSVFHHLVVSDGLYGLSGTIIGLCNHVAGFMVQK